MGEIGVSSVVAAELAYGVVKSGSSRNRQALEMFLAPLIILPFDEAAIWAYGELRAEFERRGTPIGSLDTMIAAYAISWCAEGSRSRTMGLIPSPEQSAGEGGQRRIEAHQRQETLLLQQGRQIQKQPFGAGNFAEATIGGELPAGGGAHKNRGRWIVDGR